MAVLWCSSADLVEPTSPNATAAIEWASEILFKLSGERFTGLQQVTETYGSDVFTSINLRPVVVYGDIVNLPIQTGIRDLRLRHQPVQSVVEVTFQGQLIDPSQYTLRNNAYLVKKYSVPWVLDTIDSLVVTYVYGNQIPGTGKNAAIRLANEYIWKMEGSDNSALPTRINISYTRQGETIGVLDPMKYFDDGRTGIYEVDLFLATVNPHKAKKPPKVFSADKPRGERIN
jgi:hypothetical protein